MVIKFKDDNFTLTNGNYFTPIFKTETNDFFTTIQVLLRVNGIVVVQNSINGTDWYDVKDSNIDCNPDGLQSFIECQPELLLRLKSSIEFISVNILL